MQKFLRKIVYLACEGWSASVKGLLGVQARNIVTRACPYQLFVAGRLQS